MYQFIITKALVKYQYMLISRPYRKVLLHVLLQNTILNERGASHLCPLTYSIHHERYGNMMSNPPGL